MPPPNISGGLVSETFLGVDTHSEAAAFIVGKSCSPNFLRSGEFLFGYYRFPVAVAQIPDNEEGRKGVRSLAGRCLAVLKRARSDPPLVARG